MFRGIRRKSIEVEMDKYLSAKDEVSLSESLSDVMLGICVASNAALAADNLPNIAVYALNTQLFNTGETAPS